MHQRHQRLVHVRLKEGLAYELMFRAAWVSQKRQKHHWIRDSKTGKTLWVKTRLEKSNLNS